MSLARALVWKEFRQHRAVLVAGIVLVTASPVLVALLNGIDRQAIDIDAMVHATAFACLAVIWPLLAAAVGSASIAGEREAHTLQFLLSRPISRAHAWAGKVLVAAAITGSIAPLALVVIALLGRAFPGAYPGADAVTIFLEVRLGSVGSGSLVTFCVFVFACAVLCSTVLTRPLTAAASFAFALSLAAALVFLFRRYGLSPRDGSLALGFVGLATLLLALSLSIFVKQRRP